MKVTRYPGLSDLQSGIEQDKFVLASDYDALAARFYESNKALAEVEARLDKLCDAAESLSEDNLKLVAQLAEAERDFATRMKNALLVNEQRLDELSDCKARLAEAELAAASWRREAEMNQQDANKSAGYARRLADAERLLAKAVGYCPPDLANAANALLYGTTDSAPAAPERKACTCIDPTPAKYVPDFCGMCHGRITTTVSGGAADQPPGVKP